MRQYIGARYVPIYYENSLDPTSTEWEPNVTYEPLTVVTLPNNHSYISKKTVPATIGTPAQNAAYWLDSGSEDAYIQELQDQIDALNVKVDSNFWHGKKVGVYGDSLSSPDLTYYYWQYLDDIDPTIDMVFHATGGHTIINADNTIASDPDLADYDIVVLAYGTNTWQMSQPIISALAAYKSVFNKIRTANKSCEIVCIVPFFSYKPDFGIDGQNNKGYTLYEYNKAVGVLANNYGCKFVNLMELAGVDQYNYSVMLENSSNVYVHELEPLARRIAKILYNNDWSGGHTSGISFFYEDTNNGLTVEKTDNGYHIKSFGKVTLSWLSSIASDLAEFVDFRAASCIVSGGDQSIPALLVFTNASTFAVRWLGDTTDTTVTAINLFTTSSPFNVPL